MYPKIEVINVGNAAATNKALQLPSEKSFERKIIDKKHTTNSPTPKGMDSIATAFPLIFFGVISDIYIKHIGRPYNKYIKIYFFFKKFINKNKNGF